MFILMIIINVTTQVRGVPAGVAAGGGSRQLPHPRHHLSHQVGRHHDHEDDRKDDKDQCAMIGFEKWS